MEKIDFKKILDVYTAKRGVFQIVEVPELHYLAIDGRGDPNTSAEFTQAIEALYPVAYTLKFASKRELDRDYVVMPLEGLWRAADMDVFTSARGKSQWHWTLMIMIPDWIDRAMFLAAVEKVASRKAPPRLDHVRLDSMAEGLCVQTLHVGSFDNEGPVLNQMHHEFIPDNGLRMSGDHHEIYCGDFRRTPPDKRRTILRQPVARVDPLS